MNKPTLIDEIEASCEWQELEIYVTNAGKPKDLVVGIPSRAFWRLWKRNKLRIRHLGFTVRAEDAEATGEYRTHKGKSYEIKRKQWQVQCWKPALLGIEEAPVPAEEQPF